MIEELLKKYNLKVTDKRINIIQSIIDLKEEATIKNILNNCKDMDKTTVYRNLESLEESGLKLNALAAPATLAVSCLYSHTIAWPGLQAPIEGAISR